ncbi:hypothetical protein RB195_011019 [Necator americanus]|uniref:Uncharacterized protein n=1 Tax=Necator americanus TaxID=51031 RepID=A0ABR1D0H6_NECAM
MAERSSGNSKLHHSKEGSAEGQYSPPSSAEQDKGSAEFAQHASPNAEKKKDPQISSAPTAEGLVGEELTPCSESEWLSSDVAVPAELLNIKKDEKRVTVFAAPVVDVIGESKPQKSKIAKMERKEIEEKISLVAKMVSGFAMLLTNEATAKEGVEFKLATSFIHTPWRTFRVTIRVKKTMRRRV